MSKNFFLLGNPSHSRSSRTNSFRSPNWFWEGLILHTRILKHVCPFPAGTCVAVLQMLSEMICSKELLGVITLSKFVHFLKMTYSHFPVLICCNTNLLS